MLQLLRIELYKIFRKPRTYIGFAAIAVVVLLIQLALKADGPTWLKLMFSGMDDMFAIEDGNVLNGYFVCFLILNTLLIQVPLLVALVTGDLVAGEANLGTLRLMLTKPISRTQLLLAKFAAGLVYTLVLLIWMAFLSLFLSMLFFGTSDLLVNKSYTIIQFYVDNEGDDVFWRYLAAFGFAYAALSAVAALSFMLSVFAENSIGPIVTTMSIIIVCTIISTMDLPLFTRINPYLFTSYMTSWKGLFNMAVDPETGAAIRGSVYSVRALMEALAVLVGHIVVFFGIAWYAFKRKDVLS
ncbi:MAG TPA: ABC transporter permease subunit [Phnomibacter sp.]|nr:ABC transporter permease subunit [Phnomibacter sp.]